MILQIISLVIILFMFIILIKQIKNFKKAKKQAKVINDIYKPLNDLISTLRENEKTYSKLQKHYDSEIVNLKKNENFIKLYNLGLGTVDEEFYINLISTDDPNELELALKSVKEEIKNEVKLKKACICNHGKDIVVNNKKSEAKKLFNREIRLRLRCLNNDVKSAIALADWNNINRLIKRINNSYFDINSTGELVKTYIQPNYLELKIRELRLSYEIQQLKANIKEEDREKKRRKREAEREAQKIKEAAEKAINHREHMETLIKEELENLKGSNQEQKDLLEKYQQELKVLKEKEHRAVSMAQLTRSGYVYIITNPMAFGDSICKIGMTRRVNPNERVHELSSASVPDIFTTHGFIFSEDAPKLEKELHEIFAEHRVNLANSRKEFFFVKPEEVLDKINHLYPELKIETVLIES